MKQPLPEAPLPEFKGSGDLMDQMSPPPLPPEPTIDHSKVRSMSIGPIHTHQMIQISNLRPIKLEASFNEPFSLKQALIYCLENNLPIKISAETWKSQLHIYYSNLAGFLPNFSSNLNYTHTWVLPHTSSNSRIFNTALSQPVFQGGRVLYGSLSQFYRAKGWHYAYHESINDALLDVYNKYSNMLLNRALLQIRIKAVEVDETQLRMNEQLYAAGTGTRFAVMQSRTQLALDRQALLVQQVAVRQSSLALAYSLNYPMAINLVPVENTVTEATLIDENTGINDLLGLAITHRPDLRQYEQFRLAAARNIQLQAASLYPSITLFGQFSHSSTSVHNGNGGAGGGNVTAGSTTSNSPGSSSAGFSGLGTGNTGIAFPSPQSTISSGSTGTPTTTLNGSTVSSPAANTTNTTTVNTGTPGSGQIVGGSSTGTAVQGLSQSGLVTPGSGGSGASSGGSTIGSAGVFGGLSNSWAMGVQMNWTLSGLGFAAYENIQSARALARQALLQANQQLQLVNEQVRSSYLNALTTREQIDVAATGVISSAEELRLARLRVQTGVGTNLDLINAQRDYITALVNQAQAIIASNQAQAQLLHDTGLITVDALTTGYKSPRIGDTGKRTY